jgi:hypothetical protein
MLFLKLNHLFGDFIRFKKFGSKEENKSTTGKPVESERKQVTIDQLIEVVSSDEAPPEFTEAVLANLLLGIGMSDDFNDVDELHEALAGLLSGEGRDEGPDEEYEEEMARTTLPRKASGPAKLPAAPPSSSPLSPPASSVKPSSSLPSTPAEPLKLAIMPAAEPKKANNGVARVPYCAYPVTTLDIGKREITVATTGNVNLQVATGFKLMNNDIIRLPLTEDSKVYTLARPDTSAPFKNTGPTTDNVTASTIKLPDGTAFTGLYIIIYKQSECKTVYNKLVERLNSYKFESSGGIGNTFRLITNNTNDLPKEILASVSSPVSTLKGPSSNAPVSKLPQTKNNKTPTSTNPTRILVGSSNKL